MFCTLVTVPKSHLSRAHEVWPWLMSHEAFVLSRVWRMRVQQPSSLITLLQFQSLEIDGIRSGKIVGQFYGLFSRFSEVTACHLAELLWFGFYNIHKIMQPDLSRLGLRPRSSSHYICSLNLNPPFSPILPPPPFHNSVYSILKWTTLKYRLLKL